MLAVFLIDRMRVENVRVPIFASQFDEFIRNNNADRQRLNPDVFICAYFLRIQERVNVRMKYV